MRTIQIGDRQLKDLTAEELADFIYSFGLCASSEYWNAPVITELEWSDTVTQNDKGALYFSYYQLRKEDKLRTEKTGQLYFYSALRNDADAGVYIEGFNSTRFGIPHLQHFIKLGFDVPLY